MCTNCHVDATNSTIHTIFLVIAIIGCVDTTNWNNGFSQYCATYAASWCENGKAKSGWEWTLGAKYNYPENNCCVCGKPSSS